MCVRECDGKVSDRDGRLIAFREEVEQEVGWVEAAARVEGVALGKVMGAAADESEAVERRAAEGDPARMHEEDAVELHEALGAGLMHRHDHTAAGARVASEEPRHLLG